MGYLDDLKGNVLDSEASETEKYRKSDVLNTNEFEVELCKEITSRVETGLKWKIEELGVDFRKSKAEVYNYVGEEIIICPEPITFIKEFDSISDNKAKADKLFKEKAAKFRRVELTTVPTVEGNPIWMNKTLSGVNLRPGHLNDNREDFTGVKLCDDCVHGVIVGRTGSGKSVFINQLILSLITEYAPWELDIYLADFKKVELSRYMNDGDECNHFTAYTPHVKACSATTEIRYVISMIKYLVDCMQARQELFTRLGITKIKELRDTYGIVLPRVILIVDEFQQLFTEATSREQDTVRFMLNSITKLGRATGFHLIFASQEMSGTLSNDTLSNFKVKMALPCEASVSSSILGNKAASEIERGYVVINTDSGNEVSNKKFRVPYIETDKADSSDDNCKTPFYKYIDYIKECGYIYREGLTEKLESQKFYREELQEKERTSDCRGYLDILDKVQNPKMNALCNEKSVFDAFVLGQMVTYSSNKNDKVTLSIDRGLKKSIVVASPYVDDQARIVKLLYENLSRSVKTNHIGLEVDSLIKTRFRLEDAIGDNYYRETSEVESQKIIAKMLCYRQNSLEFLRSKSELYRQIRESYTNLMGLYSDEDYVEQYNKYRFAICKLQGEISDIEDNIAEFNKVILSGLSNPIVKYLNILDKTVRVIPESNELLRISAIEDYDNVIKALTQDKNTIECIEDAIDILRETRDRLNANTSETDREKPEYNMSMARIKATVMLMRSYIKLMNKEELGENPLGNYINNAFNSVRQHSDKFEDQRETYLNAIDHIDILKSKLVESQAKLEDIKFEEDDISKNIRLMHEYLMRYIVDSLSNRHGVFDIDVVKSSNIHIGYKNNHMVVRVDNDRLSEFDTYIIDDLIKACIKAVSSNESVDATIFSRVVLWVFGLDKISRFIFNVNYDFERLSEYNILPIATIYSEIPDLTLRKAFDYYFITGNNEKLYSTLGAHYTKQPMGSIVVNCGVISNGLEIPFKLYKTNLDMEVSTGFMSSLIDKLI